MNQKAKPRPDVRDPRTAAFWEATRRGQLVLPYCPACSYLWWPPELLCPQCQRPRPQWQEVAPTGTLWSYATYHRALDPAFADDIPYVVGLVELDSGPKMYGIMVGDLTGIAIGRRVAAVFDAVDSEVTFVRWRFADT